MGPVALIAATSACGTTLPEQVDGSASDAADDATDAGDPFSPDATSVEPFHCPAAAPAEGAGCSAGFGGACAQSQGCSYGDAARQECNDLFYCIDGNWRRYGPTNLCPKDGGDACPASALGDAGSCTGTGSCALPDGNCMCSWGRWRCVVPAPSCPPSRPPPGTSCGDASPSLHCLYPENYDCRWIGCGKCGVWEEVPIYCPN